MQRLLWREPLQYRDAAHSDSPIIADMAHSQSKTHPVTDMAHSPSPTGSAEPASSFSIALATSR